MKERLRATDYRFIAVCLALLAGSTWFSVRNFYRAFPEASIDFRVSREDAGLLAGRFLATRGYVTTGYREASSFGFDDDAKTFLEREAGLERANRIMGSRVRLWRWSYRWFRPQQKEEFRTDITPSGEFAGFAHEIPEDAARPGTTAERARSLAEDFLRRSLARDPAALDFVEVSSIARPHRVDRVFTWKERDFNRRDADYRLEVTVLGDEAGGYREYLKIPERWTRDYERLRSKNEIAQLIDSAVLLALVAGLLVVIVMRVRRQDVRWRRAAMVGTVGMILSLGAQLNEFPLSEFGYPTTDAYSSFVVRRVLEALLGALGAGGLLFVLAAGAETLYREAFPGQVSLAHLFRPRGLRTRRFFRGAILGLALTGIFIAYQIVFYMVAYRFGAWSPADVPYSDLLNTRFPWLFVLFGGYLPAVSEEFLFRMFAIPFLHKLVRWLPAAVVLAGFIWGFGHAGYPQQPFFIRGVEVGIAGVALGLIMLRWGILPTLVWHYSVDAMYSALLLLRSHSLYFRLSGAASAGIIVLPVVVALVAYWRRGGFQPETGLLNGDEATAPEAPVDAAPPAAETSVPYRPLAARWQAAAAGVCVVGLLSLLIPVSHFGESPGYKLDDRKARASSDAFLRGQGVDPQVFRHVTYPAAHWGGDDALAGKYFLERRPVSFASSLFARFRPVQHWATRYFRPLDQEEFLVTVHPETGQAMGFSHTIPEDRPGAEVSPDEARRIAMAFPAAQTFGLPAMELKESRSEKKKARRDYTLVWEARAGDGRNLDEARYRVEIGVAGDRVSSLRSYWKLPEAFARSRSQQNFLSIAVLALRIGLLAGALVWAVWLLIGNTRQGLVPWRKAIRLAVVPALATVVGPLLAMQLTLESYPTAIPLETYRVVTYTILGMSAIFAFLLLTGAGAFLASFYPEGVGALGAAYRRACGKDAAAAVLAAIGLALLSYQSEAWLMDRFHAQALFSISSPDMIASAAPAAAALAGAVRSTLLRAAIAGVLVLLWGHLPRRWMRAAAVLAAPFVILPSGIHTPGEFALAYGVALIPVVGAVIFCRYFARENYLAYLLALWTLGLQPAMAVLFGNANPSLHTQGWIVAAVLAATLVWAVAPAFARKATVAPII